MTDDNSQRIKDDLKRAMDKAAAYLEEVAKRVAEEQARKIIEERKEKK